MKHKRLMGILLVVIMLCVLLLILGKSFVFGDYSYTILDDGTLKITKYTGKTPKLTIPDSFAMKQISAIGDHAFSSNNYLTAVSIPASVTQIGIAPFSSCRNLRIPLIIAPKPSTSSPLTKISRKSAIQAHCLHAK